MAAPAAEAEFRFPGRGERFHFVFNHSNMINAAACAVLDRNL
jgi:hypothetical protein